MIDDGTSISSVSEIESPAAGPRSRREKEVVPSRVFTPEERLLILDIWQRSEVPAGRFRELVGISAHSLYQWRSSTVRRVSRIVRGANARVRAGFQSRRNGRS